MSHVIELEDAYFHDSLAQALRVVESIKDPELKKKAFAITYQHLLELNSKHIEFE